MTALKERQISQRAREIRYGDGCSADEAMRRATEESREWEHLTANDPEDVK